MTEIWHELGELQISNLGRVRFLGLICYQHMNVKGYMGLTGLPNKFERRVHVLVLMAFHGPRPFANAVARHLDGWSNNNRAENLAWGTYLDNTCDMRAHSASYRPKVLITPVPYVNKLGQRRYRYENSLK